MRVEVPTRHVDDELEQVTHAFNETLGRLERSIGEMRQFSTALAHELRTPLAALRGEIELALRTMRDSRSRRVCSLHSNLKRRSLNVVTGTEKSPTGMPARTKRLLLFWDTWAVHPPRASAPAIAIRRFTARC